MAQLYYRYSTMNAGKSIELIKVAYNYEERGKQVLALIPAIDDRYGMGVITSRIGIQRGNDRQRGHQYFGAIHA